MSKKAFKLLLTLCFMLSLSVASLASANYKAEMMHEPYQHVVKAEYDGLDLGGLKSTNERMTKGLKLGNPGGCSLSFAKYKDGTTGAVWNMDLAITDTAAVEVFVKPGKNCKNAVWGLSYTGNVFGPGYMPFDRIIKEGMTDQEYAEAPFSCTGMFTCGYRNGKPVSMTINGMMRPYHVQKDGTYGWEIKGTYPDAPQTASVIAVGMLIAANCLTVDEMIEYVGAVDENFQRLSPNVAPQINVVGLNNHWSLVFGHEDSTGRHGILEFVDNYPVWHEGQNWSFNFYIQPGYCKGPDGKYVHSNPDGLGRHDAIAPYLNKVITVADHVRLMDNIRYSYMLLYNEETGYVGRDPSGKIVDWRSDLNEIDAFALRYNAIHNLNADTAEADQKYPLWQHYFNTETGELEVVDDYDYWLKNREHLVARNDIESRMAEENREEYTNMIRWHGCVAGKYNEAQLRACGAWQTYFRVVADPMHNHVTRWFNEDVRNAMTYKFDELYPVKK